MKTNPFKILVTFILLLILASCQSKSGEVYTTEKGAIGGYDPVAYFKENKPVMGDKKYEATWNDAHWYFSSQENLDAFNSDPLKYAPQYGGFCAYGTADGHKAPTLPETWTIVDDKLYLNYNLEVKELWMKDQAAFIHKADSNWTFVKKTDF
jgi:YHS domain-containing protein